MSSRAASSGGLAAASSPAPAMSNHTDGNTWVPSRPGMSRTVAPTKQTAGTQTRASSMPLRTIRSVIRPLRSVPISAPTTSSASTNSAEAWLAW